MKRSESDSLMSNIKSSTDVDSQDKSYKNLEIERSQKKRDRYILIASIVISIISLSLISILIFFIFRSYKKGKKNNYEFIYINDIHLDPLYVTDSSPSNCRASSGSGIRYPFGQYGCDCPLSTFLSMINFLPKVTSKPQFILYGGDGPAHQLGYNISQVRELVNSIITNISSVFPKVPILFALGNNDFVPNYGNNDFSGDEANFKSIGTVMRPFMDDLQRSTFEKGGYYYHDFHEMKLRFVIMNSIIYNTYRQFSDDPYGQFEWLRQICVEARNGGYSIGVSFHIPPGVTYNTMSKLNQGWHEEYMKKFDKIVDDFDIQFVISAHSHYDMFVPLYMPNGTSGAFSLSAPSVSSQHKNNPAFRVMKFADGKIIDYVQYYADIMLNPQEELDWQIEYSFGDEYNAKDVGKSELFRLANWIKNTGKGRWTYLEKICSLASENGLFYYCVLTRTTEDEIKKCLGPGLNSKKSISQFFPYGGER